MRVPLARQKGVALLTALLVVALATTAAVGLTARQQLEVRRAANVLTGDQALLYGLAVEAYALRLLGGIEKIEDLPWQGCRSPEVPMDFEEAQISAWLEDLQCRFNLNNVQPGSGAGLADFVALLGTLNGANAEAGVDAEAVGRALQDWVDPQVDDPAYAQRVPAYLSANQPLLHPSELRLVDGMSAPAWALLAPHVTALPETTGLRLDDALPPIREAFGGRSEGPEPAPRFFRLSVEVRLGRHRSLLCSTLDAARNRVILRELSPCGV